ncbi:hypothetical protein Slu03_17730 [Sediminihabitans luteus]|nr:hypothetical protein Slu03_17730 [Sediminihabitans luteus]
MVSVTLAAVLGLVLAGCGVRVDTPPPTEPSPDAQELVRSAAVTDALTVGATARAAAASLADEGGEDADAVVPLLEQIADFSDQHVVQLGGVYDSGLPDAPEQPDPEATLAVSDGTVTEKPAPTTADVLEALTGASARTRASAIGAEDGGLARLLASVSTSQVLSAERLATVSGVDLPETKVPAEPEVTTTAPPGAAAGDLATLVESEDAAGYAYEVAAARSEGTTRSRSLALAAAHRERAQLLAEAAGIDGSATDPRRVAYALPEGAVADVAQEVELDLATGYASMAGTVLGEGRTPVLDLLTASQRAATTWGAPLVAFPGMPERAGS